MAMVNAICFYLPQFHPLPENDAWWGEGFTEWRNVVRAVPNFSGHYQPHLPSELGCYDLRDPIVQLRQAELARAHGIHGFCYYFYWFNGRRVLERPLNQLLERRDIEFPFCICWANENWTRTWDGLEKDVLLSQSHSPEDDLAFFDAVLPYLRDERYIRVQGKPMLLVYRADLFPDAMATAERWRRRAKEAGLPGIHLCAVQFYGITDPRPWGFDAAVEFPPHQLIGGENRQDALPALTNPKFTGTLVDYQKVMAQALAREPVGYLRYRGVMPMWDNTARRQNTSHIFVNSSPVDYHQWLSRIVTRTEDELPTAHRYVFINAWNEWGEGCHLEPDLRFGRAYLDATLSALEGRAAVGTVVFGPKGSEQGEELAEAFAARERSIVALQEVIRQKNLELEQRHAIRAADMGRVLWNVARTEASRYPRFFSALKRLRHVVRRSER